MVKKNKTIKIITALVVIGLVYAFVSGKIPLATTGFGTLSLGQHSFSETGDTFTKQWFLTIVGNGQGDYASIVMSPEQLKDSATGIKPEKPLTFTIESQTQTASYPIKGSSVANIYRIGVVDTGALFLSCTKDRAPNGFATQVWGSFPSHCYVYTYTLEGTKGTIINPDISFSADFILSNGVDVKKATVSNKLTAAKLGTATINWQGSLVSGESIPSGQGYAAGFKNKENTWRVFTQDVLNKYNSLSGSDGNPLTSVQGDFWSCIKSSTNPNPQNCVAVWNGRLDGSSGLWGAYSWSIFGGITRSVTGTSTNGQVLIDITGKRIQFPVFTVIVDAAWIGIVRPVGQPSFNSAFCADFTTGQTGIIKTSVKNIGSGTGTFDVSASCSQGISQQGGAVRTTGLAPGQSQDLYIPILGQTAQSSLTSPCQLTAIDVHNPAKIATTSTTCTVKGIPTCSEGQIRCGFNKIEKCTNNVWITKEQCVAGQYCTEVTGTPTCSVPTGGGGQPPIITPPLGECAWYDVPCKLSKLFGECKPVLGFLPNVGCEIEKILRIIGFALGLLAGVFAYLFTFRFAHGAKIKKPIPTLVGLVVGLAVFMLVYTIWLFALIAVIIFYFFGSLIKAKISGLGR